MVKRINENDEPKYLRYVVTTSLYKQDVIKVSVVDNYFDKSDYAFVDMKTGELYSYNSVATNFVFSVVSNANINAYEMKPNEVYKLYTKPHSNEIIKVSKNMKEGLTESVEIVAANADDVKKHLGYDEADIADCTGRKLPDVGKTYYLAYSNNKVGKAIGYKLGEDLYGFIDTELGNCRHNIAKDQMEFWLENSLCESEHKMCEEAKESDHSKSKCMLDLGHAIQALNHTDTFYNDHLRVFKTSAEALLNSIKTAHKDKEDLNKDQICSLADDMKKKLSLMKDIRDFLDSDLEEFEKCYEYIKSLFK